MSLLDVVILALVQGVTEFLPISSSGHLVLARSLLCLELAEGQSLLLDVCLHAGSLVAVLAICWREVKTLLAGVVPLVRRQWAAVPPLLWYLILTTLPVVVVGLIVSVAFSDAWRTDWVVAVTTLVFGGALLAADRTGNKDLEMDALTWRAALFVGLAQCLAIIPGVSRAGIVVTAGLLIGLNRLAAARLALLTGIPTITLAGALGLARLSVEPDASFLLTTLVGVAAAAVSAWLATVLMLRWVRDFSYTPFVVYRVVLGGGLLILLAAGGFALVCG